MLLLVGTPQDVSTVHVDAGHWATIGNSGTRPAAVRGADIALTYEPNGGFSRVTVVPPGEAAFVFSAADTDGLSRSIFRRRSGRRTAGRGGLSAGVAGRNGVRGFTD